MRVSLRGKWRISKRPALVLSLMAMLGLGLLSWTPKEFEILRLIGLVLGAFSAGMIASQHAVIWESSENSAQPLTGEPVKMEQEIAELKAKLAEAEVYAERYRWLKEERFDKPYAVTNEHMTAVYEGDDLDKAIDAAKRGNVSALS